MPAGTLSLDNRALSRACWELSVSQASMALTGNLVSMQSASQPQRKIRNFKQKDLDFKRKAEDESLDIYSIPEYIPTVIIKQEASSEESALFPTRTRQYRTRPRADLYAGHKGKFADQVHKQVTYAKYPQRDPSPSLKRNRKTARRRQSRSTSPQIRRNPPRAARFSHAPLPFDVDCPRKRIVREVYADTSLSNERQLAIIALLEDKDENTLVVKDTFPMVHPSRRVLLANELKKSTPVLAIESKKEAQPQSAICGVKIDSFRTSIATPTRSLMPIEMAKIFRTLKTKRSNRCHTLSPHTSIRSKRASPPCMPARGHELSLAIIEHTKARVEQVVRQVFSYTQYMKAKIHKSVPLVNNGKQEHARIRRQPCSNRRSRSTRHLIGLNKLGYGTSGGTLEMLPAVNFNMVELLRSMEGLLRSNT